MKPRQIDSQGARVLVVEDDPSIRFILKEALESNHLDARVVSSAVEAITEIQKFHPHLVITDHDMPEMTGLELLQTLRKEQNYVTVIFISGRADSGLIVETLRAGADDYITKPFDVNELLARVEVSLRVNEVHRELLEANQKLQNMVEHDDLTGLFNMRSMYDRIDFELKRAKRFHRHVACVMLDMDHFKRVNDEHDHLFGSFVLKEMGNIIRGEIREVDVAARYGGDEFLIVLTETKIEGIESFCDRLRQRIAEYKFQEGDHSIQLTASLGYFLSDGVLKYDARAMVRLADQALYQAKDQGRNCCVGSVAADPTESKS